MNESEGGRDERSLRARPEQVEGDVELWVCVESMLVAEFEYVAHTAFQSNEDRARTTFYYLATVGSLVAALFGSQALDLSQPAICWGFSAVFLGLSFVGWLNVQQLAQLRDAWCESVEVMNEMKDIYVRRFRDVINLEDAFVWKSDNNPPRFKASSMSFLLALQISVLAGSALAAAVIFAGLSFEALWWRYAIPLGIACAVLQLVSYYLALPSKSKSR